MKMDELSHQPRLIRDYLFSPFYLLDGVSERVILRALTMPVCVICGQLTDAFAGTSKGECKRRRFDRNSLAIAWSRAAADPCNP